MKEKALKLLGLMRRANAIQPGEDRAGDAVRFVPITPEAFRRREAEAWR